jgi:polyhydroxyalkanoate synthesis regulator protein
LKQYQKYDNRKLYDTDTGEYVSMLELSDVVAAGEAVRVTHYRTQRDVTLETLARSLYERLSDRRVSAGQPFEPACLSVLFAKVRRRRRG